ncbi:MAG: polysaccharide deacetylase family protein [Clostridium sp.]
MKKKVTLLCFLLMMTMLFTACDKSDDKEDNNVNTWMKNETTENNKEEVMENKDFLDNEEEEVKDEEQLIQEEEPVKEKEVIEYITMAPENVRIPILMYHSISGANPDNSLLVPPAMFKEQMDWLNNNGFTTMTLDETLDSLSTGKVPKKPVVVTFDDGYVDNYTAAFPVLKENNMKGVFFVITDYMGETAGNSMSIDMLKEMKAAGMEIENHTSNHLELNSLSREDAYSSIKNGQNFLKDVLGVESKYLCYPAGRYSEVTIEIEKELGIKAAVTTQGGISSNTDGNYELKRVRMSPMSIEGFQGIFDEFQQ